MTRLRASIILLAFAFIVIAAPLVASNGTCAMACCKHGKSASLRMPACPLPQQCPSMAREAETSDRDNATPAPAQPVVHAVPSVVALVTTPPALRPASQDEVPLASRTSERPLYLADSVFLI